MMNSVSLQGRLVSNDKIKATYNEGDDNKKSFYGGVISVRRDRKGENDEYYPEDLFRIQAYGQTADYLGRYCQNEEVIIMGRLTKGEEYEKDGEIKKPGDYVTVDRAWHCGPVNKEKSEGETKKDSKKNGANKAPAANKSKTGSNPFTAGANKPKTGGVPWAK